MLQAILIIIGILVLILFCLCIFSIIKISGRESRWEESHNQEFFKEQEQEKNID